MLKLFGLLASLCYLAFATTALAADRVALIIGMSDYQTISPLTNTTNDARGISETLSNIGFQVTTLIDSTGSEMEQALAEFRFASETADLALVYFAGHGIEVQGENYLVPVDAQVRSNQDVQDQSFSLDDMLKAVEHARKMRIVILDSCRNDPFGDAIQADGTEPAATMRRRVGWRRSIPTGARLVAFRRTRRPGGLRRRRSEQPLCPGADGFPASAGP